MIVKKDRIIEYVKNRQATEITFYDRQEIDELPELSILLQSVDRYGTTGLLLSDNSGNLYAIIGDVPNTKIILRKVVDDDDEI